MAGTPQEILDAINLALQNGGVVEVQQPDGARVRYSTLSELMGARERIQAEVNAAGGTPVFNEIQFRRPID